MVYLVGGNDLASAGEADLAEMRRIGSSAEVTLERSAKIGGG
jgi:hypothetical protein